MLTSKRFEDYGNFIQRIYRRDDRHSIAACREITFQVTSGCNLRCGYCYEHHKGHQRMSLDTAKDICNLILDMFEHRDNESDFINDRSIAVVLSFIGGEPLLEAALIERICDYWFAEVYRRRLPLAPFTRISFATNGLLWFDPEAQHLIQKYHDQMSVTVSIDGVRELHDRFRVDENGKGSFSAAFRAFQDGKKYGWYNSKMTFVPASFQYIFDSVKMMVEEGCTKIACNYAYEPEYSEQDAAALYAQLKKLADWIIDENKDVYVTMLGDHVGYPDELNDRNFCGGTGEMLAFAPDGKAYPCIRYAPISIGEEKAEKVCIGDHKGLWATKPQQEVRDKLGAITKTSQSPEKCLTCPVAAGCGWCSGYNYECTGTPDHRITHICLAHKARSLACAYYYNRRYLKIGDVEPIKVFLPKDEAEHLIGPESAEEVYQLEKQVAIAMASRK
ncbi:MAG: radical SAM protein [Faecalibacterium sp.]